MEGLVFKLVSVHPIRNRLARYHHQASTQRPDLQTKPGQVEEEAQETTVEEVMRKMRKKRIVNRRKGREDQEKAEMQFC